MKILFMGTPEFAVNSLESLIENNFEIVGVVTQPDKVQGRKREIIYSPVKELALKHNLQIFQPFKIKEIVDDLLNLGADLIVTAAYGQILPKSLIDNIKAINVHGSLLPAYRGGAPIQYALFDGLDKTGVTIMDMAFKMDSGDIILQGEVDILEEDNYETLSNKMAILGSKLLIDVLNGDYKRTKQDESLVTFAYTLKREDEFLNFYSKTSNVINHLKGLLPEPAGSIKINDVILKVFKMQKSDIIINGIEQYEIGQIFVDKSNLIIKTLDGLVEILEIQAPGKRKMNIKDFLNGQKVVKNKDYVERGRSYE